MVHWFDIFIAVFLAASGFWSYFRGFVKEAFALGSLVAGYLAASWLYLPVSEHFKVIGGGKLLHEAAGFVSIFILAAVMVELAGALFRRALNLSGPLGAADRIGGVALGLVKGVLLLAIFAYPVAMIPGPAKAYVQGSKTFYPLAGAGGALMEAMAPGLVTRLEKAGDSAAKDKKNSEDVKEYRKKFRELRENVAGEARKLGEKLGMEEGDRAKKRNSKEEKKTDDITESDRKELDKLLEKHDR